MQARNRTLLYVLLLPWALFILLMSFIAANNFRSRSPRWEEVLGIWFVIGMVGNLVFSLRARACLYSSFRVLATDRFQPPKPGGFFRSATVPANSAPGSAGFAT